MKVNTGLFDMPGHLTYRSDSEVFFSAFGSVTLPGGSW